jgi:ubiquinone/menaquinone biosynthesis C-methylase UbiE
MAAMAGADVTGRVGLSDRTTFVTTPGESLPLDDDAFDVAVMVHVGMNIPDKEAVFREVHRELEAAGFTVEEIEDYTPGGPPPAGR